jgi:tetratricopeptide (TPR) repeat protein
MKTLFRFLAVVVLAVVPLTSFAQQGSSSWLTESERVRFEQLRESGFQALYNLDYEKARRSFSEIGQTFPQHPAGPQFLASALWIETLYKTRRLQSSLYSSKSFYANDEEKPDAAVIEQFRNRIREAQRLSQNRLKQYPQDVEALYFLGATQALKACFEEGVERRHIAALRDGQDAVENHRQALKLDANYHDAEVTIGLYDYVVGSLPFPAKILAGVVGARGSKKRGLATIERVAKDGKNAIDQAKTLLIVLYTREKRYAEAAALASEFATRYPRNYLYRLEAADALVSQSTLERTLNHQSASDIRSLDQALAIFETLLHDTSVSETAVRAFDLIHYKYGEALLKAGRTDQAAQEFLAAAKVEGAEAGLATMAHLCAAQALDAGRKRTEALAQYQTVLARPDVYDAHDEARKGLRSPFKVEVLAQR